MTEEQLGAIRQYVNSHIDDFHNQRIEGIKGLKLKKVLEKKNPYMFRTKDIHTPHELIEPILQAHSSSSEESQFGNFMEGLAVFCSELLQNSQKAPSSGLDLMFIRDGVHYVVGIKSASNWGNSSQWAKLRDDFKRAVKVLKQSKDTGEVIPVLGICYGKVRSSHNGQFLKICGQEFWEFISGDPNLYLEIIEPLGFEAEKHNERFELERAATLTRFVHEFTLDFCDSNYYIDWEKLARFNSERRPVKSANAKSK